MTVELEGLTPPAEEGWDTLFDLNEVDPASWLLVGGQMMHLLGVEHGAAVIRPTDDVDVVVDVRARPQGTRWLSDCLQHRGFTIEGASPDQIGHCFARPRLPRPRNGRLRRARSRMPGPARLAHPRCSSPASP